MKKPVSGRARVHRRLHLSFNEEQGGEPAIGRRTFSQVDRRLAVSEMT